MNNLTHTLNNFLNAKCSLRLIDKDGIKVDKTTSLSIILKNIKSNVEYRIRIYRNAEYIGCLDTIGDELYDHSCQDIIYDLIHEPL